MESSISDAASSSTTSKPKPRRTTFCCFSMLFVLTMYHMMDLSYIGSSIRTTTSTTTTTAVVTTTTTNTISNLIAIIDADGDSANNTATSPDDLGGGGGGDTDDTDEGGGVIIFYHVAKTGGTTIRDYFMYLQRNYKNQYVYQRYKNPYFESTWKSSSKFSSSSNSKTAKTTANNTSSATDSHTNGTSKSNPTSCSFPPKESIEGKMELLDLLIDEFLNVKPSSNSSGQRKPTLLLEIHDGPPGLRYLEPYFEKWKNWATTSSNPKRPFLIFTLVREPISYAISYYKFFHVNCNASWCEHNGGIHKTPNIVHFLQTLHNNQQCFLLSHTSSVAGMSPTYYQECQPTRQDCEYVYNNIMNKYMNYIGTTDTISTDTIPYLEQYLGHTISPSSSFLEESKADKKTNTRKGIQNKTNVAKHYNFERHIYSNDNIQIQLEDMLVHDIWLYNQVKQKRHKQKLSIRGY